MQIQCRLSQLINTQTYKPGPGLLKDIIYILEQSKDTELKNFFLGKTLNANESFNGTIWERIPKNTFVTYLIYNLVYMMVQHTVILE